jgi:hypothetical protein
MFFAFNWWLKKLNEKHFLDLIKISAMTVLVENFSEIAYGFFVKGCNRWKR